MLFTTQHVLKCIGGRKIFSLVVLNCLNTSADKYWQHFFKIPDVIPTALIGNHCFICIHAYIWSSTAILWHYVFFFIFLCLFHKGKLAVLCLPHTSPVLFMLVAILFWCCRTLLLYFLLFFIKLVVACYANRSASDLQHI